MGQPIYITDPAVAAAYFVAPGEFAYVADDAEATWLLETHQGYPHEANRALPAPGFVHPQAPQPFVPYGSAPPPGGGTVPAKMIVNVANPTAGVFLVNFTGTTDQVVATAHFVVRDNADQVLADLTYEHPLNTTPQDAADMLYAALLPTAALTLDLVAAVVDIRGTDPVVVGDVEGEISVPAATKGSAGTGRSRWARRKP
jgi:hypothetical protein